MLIHAEKETREGEGACVFVKRGDTYYFLNLQLLKAEMVPLGRVTASRLKYGLLLIPASRTHGTASLPFERPDDLRCGHG